MSSITVEELKILLNDIPDDYEVIVEVKKNTIGMINGLQRDDEWKEVRLLL